jgi:hypothetical protein
MDKEPAVIVCEPDATMQPAPQSTDAEALRSQLLAATSYLNGEASTDRKNDPIIPPA